MNNTHIEKRLKGALESLPWLLQSTKGIVSLTSTGWGFRLTKDYRGDISRVSIRKIEGIYSKRICFDIGEEGIQGKLEVSFLTEHLGDYFSDLTNPRSEEIQLFSTIHPEHCDFIIEMCDYFTCIVDRSFYPLNLNT